MANTLIFKSKNDNKLIINEQCLKKIESIKENVAICSIIGSYRSGKSTLLNHLNELFCKQSNVSNSSSFKIGHGVEACTKGLNMCSSIPILSIANQNTHLIFIDSEGLDSDEANSDSWDVKVFMTTMLISSVFMFNGLKTLNKQDFNRLSLVTNLCDQIKLKENYSKVMNRKKLKEECNPDFIWLVRDFSLKLEKTKDEYLSSFFEPEDYEDECNEKDLKIRNEIDRRNEIKENLETFFKTINCALLSQPISDESDLQNMDKIKMKDLKSNYLKDLNHLYEQIKDLIQPKEINGQKMNGPLFAEYLKLIVQSINENKTIYLYDTVNLAMKTIVDNQINELMIKEFDQKFDPKSFPIKLDLLDKNLNKSKENCSLKFKSYPNHLSRLNQKCDEKIASIKNQNKIKIREKDVELALKYWKEKFSYSIETKYTSTSEFDKDIEVFKNEFKKSKLFDSNETSHLNDDKFWNEIFNDNQVNLTNLKEKIIQKEQQRVRDEEKRLQQIKISQQQDYDSDLDNQMSLFDSLLQGSSGIGGFSSPVSSSCSSYRTSNPSPQTLRYDNPRSMYHGRELHVGPKGGIYYVDNHGNKIYQ